MKSDTSMQSAIELSEVVLYIEKALLALQNIDIALFFLPIMQCA